jgi:transcriptional regulator with XRE-family HTH domain
MKQPTNVIDQARHAILNADVSQYRISKDTGLDKSMLSRFARSKHEMSLANFSALCAYLGLSLESNGKKQRPPNRKRKGK